MDTMPGWKRLVDELISRNHASPYLDRLRERLAAHDTPASIEAELVQEMASALGRTED